MSLTFSDMVDIMQSALILLLAFNIYWLSKGENSDNSNVRSIADKTINKHNGAEHTPCCNDWGCHGCEDCDCPDCLDGENK